MHFKNIPVEAHTLGFPFQKHKYVYINELLNCLAYMVDRAKTAEY